MNDLTEILNKIEVQGWRIERDKRHYKCYPPDKTKRMVTIQTTPSGPRWKANLIAHLRRSGADLYPRSALPDHRTDEGAPMNAPDGWTVTLDVAHGPLDLSTEEHEAAVAELLDALAEHSGSVSSAADRYSVTISINLG